MGELKKQDRSNDLLSVPVGWVKGEQVTISRKTIGGIIAWVITQGRSLQYIDVPANSIYAIYFHSDAEFYRWLNWWFDR